MEQSRVPDPAAIDDGATGTAKRVSAASFKRRLPHYPSLDGDLENSRFERLQNALALASLGERSGCVPTSAKSSLFLSQTIQLQRVGKRLEPLVGLFIADYAARGPGSRGGTSQLMPVWVIGARLGWARLFPRLRIGLSLAPLHSQRDGQFIGLRADGS
jgi:hypothetical protein